MYSVRAPASGLMHGESRLRLCLFVLLLASFPVSLALASACGMGRGT